MRCCQCGRDAAPLGEQTAMEAKPGVNRALHFSFTTENQCIVFVFEDQVAKVQVRLINIPCEIPSLLILHHSSVCLDTNSTIVNVVNAEAGCSPISERTSSDTTSHQETKDSVNILVAEALQVTNETWSLWESRGFFHRSKLVARIVGLTHSVL